MWFARIVLGVTALIFVGYGIACLLSPSLPAGYVGLVLGGAGGTAATVEFGAMYGGLQIAMGLVFGWHLRDRARTHSGVGIMATLLGGLGIARTIGLLAYGIDPYNIGAVCYELGSTVLAVIAWSATRERTRRHSG